MPDNTTFVTHFGNAGKRTVRIEVGAVEVSKSNGEYLSYRLQVRGAQAIFTFACEHRALLSETDFPGHPLATYEWKWGKSGPEIDASDDVYGVRMSFLSAIKYTLLVHHCRRDNSIIKILKDIDYESQDPTDKFVEPIRVFTS